MKLVLRFSMILLFTFFLASCEEGVEISRIEVMHDSSEVIVLDDFDLSNLTLRITYSDNKFMEIPLSESMLSTNDLSLLSSVGNHTINVSYEGFETTVTIRLDDDTLTKQLRSFYTLSQTSNSFEGTYEEWLASIQGPAGTDGREVSFKVSDGYIQWQYIGDTEWTNLVELTTLVGPKGEDGQTPYIGENGNWWIGETDTGVLAGNNLNNQEPFTEGLIFTKIYLNQTFSHVITDYIGTEVDVIIPSYFNGLKVIGISNSVFSYVQLKTVVIPNSVTHIGVLAFHGNQLTNIVIPNSVTHIGGGSFSSNQLTNVVIPNSVTHIGDGAFSGNQLTNVVIPNSVTHIGSEAFSYNQLTSVIIPSSVTYIGDWAFSSNQLTSVLIEGNEGRFNSKWDDIGFSSIQRPGVINYQGILFDSYINEIIDYEGINQDVIIPNEIGGFQVTSIGRRAFSYKNLTSVIIPNSVTTIRESAFLWNKLSNVIIPNSVTSIGQSAFQGNRLISVTIPDGLTTIEHGVFSVNQLTSLIIPNSVTRIERNAFERNQLISLIIPNSVTHIGNNAFSQNKLTSVVISYSVTNIGWSAFENNPLLTSVLIEGEETRFNDRWVSLGFPIDLKPS